MVRRATTVQNKAHSSDYIARLFARGIYTPSPPLVLSSQLRLQMLVDGIGDGLARRNAHDARRDASIQRLETFLLEERAGNGDGVRETRVARGSRVLLD